MNDSIKNVNHKLDIKPFFIPGLTCLQNSIMTVLVWKKGQYKLCFNDSWGFEYNENKDPENRTIGKKVSAGNTSIDKNIVDFYGIKTKMHTGDSKEQARETIRKELMDGRPVTIFIDSYYVYWQPPYQQQHGNHWCNIIGFDDEKGYHCIESMPILEDLFLTFDNFDSGYKDYATYEIDSKTKDGINIIQVLKNCIVKLKVNTQENVFSKMRAFADAIETIDVAAEIALADSVWHIPLFKNINKVYGGREQFLEMLEFVEEYHKMDSLSHLVEMFRTITIKWSIIRTLIFKVCDQGLGAASLKKISNKIHEIADLEENTANYISELVEVISVDQTLDDVSEDIPMAVTSLEHNSNYLFDLRNYFNHISHFFSFYDHDYKDAIPTESIWNVENMRFQFPDIKGEKFDNVSCMGQWISVPNARYQTIMLLGYGTWGSQVEDLIIKFEDGFEKAIEITFSDWNEEPQFKENIAWRGILINKSDLAKIKAKIFAKAYPIKERGQVTSIRLPNSENVHIFAITFSKGEK